MQAECQELPDELNGMSSAGRGHLKTLKAPVRGSWIVSPTDGLGGDEYGKSK